MPVRDAQGFGFRPQELLNYISHSGSSQRAASFSAKPRTEGSPLTLPDRVLDYARRSDGIFVFPDSDNPPAGFTETAICVGVASLVSLDLGDPEVGVLLRRPMMLRAAMPEAPIEKDRDLGSSENDVRSAADLRHWTQPYSITQA